MLNITIPNNNIKERTYILDVIFEEFLGVEYCLKVGSQEYEISLLNTKILTIKDSFFNKYPNDLEYLKLENIPKSIKELDVFSACFFMLTRWEEYVNKTRDKHNRFPAYASLAYIEGFLDRPIVNELIEELKQNLLALDSNLVFQERKFELILTHDVDEVHKWKSFFQVARVVIGDIFKRKSLTLGYSRLKEYALIQSFKIVDPYDTFTWLMEKSEAIGIKSKFYFMSGGITEYDNRYKISSQKNLIQQIQQRGHVVGIHPSYNAYDDIQQLQKEKELLEEVCGCKIEEGREHYLRFEVPATWQIWEDTGMKIDSTCGYADREGFRCGTGDSFSIFNILTSKKLALKERPLIYMDDNRLEGERIYDEEKLVKNILDLIDQAKLYNSKITLLFHQSIFADEKINYKAIYEKVIS